MHLTVFWPVIGSGDGMGERIAARNERQLPRSVLGSRSAATMLRLCSLKRTYASTPAIIAGACFSPKPPAVAVRQRPARLAGARLYASYCVNFVVDDRHIRYWEDRRGRNLALQDDASPLVRAVLDEVIEQCDRCWVKSRSDKMVGKEREAHCRTSVADKTARAYRAALKRLSEGQATHPDLVGRPVRIAPATVAREALA